MKKDAYIYAIIGYHDTFEESGFVNIDHCHGVRGRGRLGRLIAKRLKEGDARFSETEIKRYATQLGSALSSIS